MLTLLDINFTSYIPTSLLGLLGLISGYLFFYFKNKNNNKLKEIQSVNPKDRIKAIEMSLNELGVTIDTSTLSSSQKIKLIKRILNAKTKRYLIFSITLIIISLLITLLIWKNKNTNAPLHSTSDVSTIKAPPDIDVPDGEYPSLHDNFEGDIACQTEEQKIVILVKIIYNDDGYTHDAYILEDKNGVHETYYFDGSDLSNAEASWTNTIMVIGRRLKIEYDVCGSGGIHYLRYIEPIRYYKK